jgi:hypothetical protein
MRSWPNIADGNRCERPLTFEAVKAKPAQGLVASAPGLARAVKRDQSSSSCLWICHGVQVQPEADVEHLQVLSRDGAR